MSGKFRDVLRVMTSTTVLASSILATGLCVSSALAIRLIQSSSRSSTALKRPRPRKAPRPAWRSSRSTRTTRTLLRDQLHTARRNRDLAHFHGPAMKGDVAGRVWRPLSCTTSPSARRRGRRRSAARSRGALSSVTSSSRRYLKNGLCYINVHTTGTPPASTTGEDPRPGAAAEDQVQERARDRDVDHHADDLHDHDHDGFAERRVRGLSPRRNRRRASTRGRRRQREPDQRPVVVGRPG